MNTKSIAIALVAGVTFAASVQAADTIPTLPTVEVRPSTEQLAQAEHERNSDIPTLATVQVRPSVGQLLERMAEQTASRLAANTPVAIGANLGQWGFTLPASSVQPDARQLKELAAQIAANAVESAIAQGLVSN